MPTDATATESSQQIRAPRRKRRRLLLASLGTILVLAGAVWLYKEITIHMAARAARRAVAAGRWQDVSVPLARWIRARPESAEANFVRAQVADHFHRNKDALAALGRARVLGYPDLPIDRLGGLILARAGRHGEAEDLLVKARNASREPDPELDQVLARACIETSHFGTADEAIAHWIRDAPADPRPFLLRTEISRRKDLDSTPRILDYSEALKRDPNLDEARIGLADALRAADRYAEADAAYAAYIARKPDDPAGHLGAGRNALEQGDKASALRHLDRAVALAPENSEILVERAGIDLRRGDAAGALALLDRAAHAAPHDFEIRYHRAEALIRLGRREEARAEQDAAARLKKENDQLSSIRDGLLRNPNDLALQREAAHWFIEHGEGKEGLTWAIQVLRAEPGDPDMNRLLADYYEKEGKPGLANFYRAAAEPKK